MLSTSGRLDAAPLDPQARCLLCGGRDMVVDVRDLLIRRRAPSRQTLWEICF